MAMDDRVRREGEQGNMEMRMEENDYQPVDTKRLWFAVGAGPILWAIHLVASYALASLPCITPVFNDSILGMPAIRFILLIFTLVMALVVFVAGFMGYEAWQSLKEHEPEGERRFAPGATRPRFMAFSGISLSVLFGVAILANLGPILALNVCSL
jgi:hypothetical protein